MKNYYIFLINSLNFIKLKLIHIYYYLHLFSETYKVDYYNFFQFINHMNQNFYQI